MTPEARRLVESFIRDQASKLTASEALLRNAETAVEHERGMVALHRSNLTELRQLLAETGLAEEPPAAPEAKTYRVVCRHPIRAPLWFRESVTGEIRLLTKSDAEKWAAILQTHSVSWGGAPDWRCAVVPPEEADAVPSTGKSSW